MRLASHVNVLNCFASFVAGDKLWLVTQLMSKGSTLHVLSLTKSMGLGVGFSEQYTTFILHQTLLGLKYLHESNGQIHRDVKAGNILVDGEGGVRIADFGVSGWLTSQNGDRRENTKTFVGTPCWMAPEVMEQMVGYDFKADIWSFGITALELAKGAAPYAHYPPMKVLLLTIQEDPPSLDSYDSSDDNYSKTFKELIKNCLQKDPKKRPIASQLLAHKHFKQFTDEEFVNSERQAFKNNVLSLVGDFSMDNNNIANNNYNTTEASALNNNNNNHNNVILDNDATLVSGNNNSNNNNNNNNNGNINNKHSSSAIQVLIEGRENRPAGTTWVFSDGSQVLVSGGDKATHKRNTSDGEGDFFDEFEKKTGGENFKLEQKKMQASQLEEEKLIKAEEERQKVREEHDKGGGGGGGGGEDDDDDNTSFFDEFEATTKGENADRT